MTFPPTDEQAVAIDLYGTGENLVIQAGAGTGKTSTLEFMARSNDRRRIQYLAFNRAIAQDAAARMPAHVSARTAHSVAFGAHGKKFADRLNAGRQSGREMARLLGIDPITVTYGDLRKTLDAGFLAGHVYRAVSNFCQSADPEPDTRHFDVIKGIDPPAADGRRTYDNNNAVREELLPAVRRCWQDSLLVDGRLRYSPDRYLKAWQLAGPRIACDVLFFDEAQDVSPVLAAIAEYQAPWAQLVYVGDSNQAIYEWLGAVDAMDKLPSAYEAVLSQSFRFGPEVADVANVLLSELDSVLRLTGFDQIPSVVGPIDGDVDAVLTRSNAKGVEVVLDAMADGRKAHLVGGADSVRQFAEAAEELKTTGSTGHPELACFGSWGEVEEYVAADALGGELRLLVDLVDKFGTQAIIKGTKAMPDERSAEFIVSTAHKSKGREWGRVQLASDFPGGSDDGEWDPSELRLLYVAATRAKLALDLSRVPFFQELPEAVTA